MRRIVISMSCMACALAGCAEGGLIKVDANDGPAIRMSGLGSRYTWAQMPDPALGNPEIQAVIADLIDQELARKGFEKSDVPSASFWIDFHVMKEEKTDSSVYPHGVIYPRGTLIIRLIDPPTHRIIWAASAQAEIMASATAEERRDRVQNAVRMMLARMPGK
ncbi:MAG TPA: DUF4136 domain-containing protein [Phycisphaerae bacterium]|nr:DUF4136 domain-containing protein [Phycisphaerae bacterium]